MRGYTSMYFGENQLSPRSIGISPLPTAHPRHLQLAWVQTSTGCYPRFILAMGSSRGFGSTARHYASPAPPERGRDPPALFRLALAPAPLHKELRLATCCDSPVHSSIGTPSDGPPPLAG